jgi:hypothetical protein
MSAGVANSAVCLSLCKGRCCDPWWGIIFYRVIKERGASFGDFGRELERSIRERAERIKANSVTKQNPPRPLFKDPEIYNIKVENLSKADGSIIVALRAMFGFRCAFFSPDGACSIHPGIVGEEIRPPQCAELGNPAAKEGERDYCRVISASAKDPSSAAAAIEIERKSSLRHLKEGVPTAKEAAESVIKEIRNAFEPISAKKTGRNEPCPCGSGKKYKVCHGG